jgi:hypothetical protein
VVVVLLSKQLFVTAVGLEMMVIVVVVAAIAVGIASGICSFDLVRPQTAVCDKGSL